VDHGGRVLKLALIAAGYVAAFLIAGAVVAGRVATTSGPDAQASSGMYAFGDAVLFIAVFGFCSLAPTAVALFLLRPYRRFWTWLAAAVVAVASTGVAAAMLFALGRHETSSPLAVLAMASVLRILLAPLLALVFLVFGVFSPYRSPRVALLAGSAAEVAVSVYGGLVWVAPLLLHRV
jgi:hypothetical protein